MAEWEDKARAAWRDAEARCKAAEAEVERLRKQPVVVR